MNRMSCLCLLGLFSFVLTSVGAELENHPPVLDPIGSQTVVVGDTLELIITASDPDSDALSFSIVNQPENSTFTDLGNDTAIFLFYPDFSQEGILYVMFMAGDGEYTDDELVQIRVMVTNLPPILNDPGPQAVNEGDMLSFLATASDDDGDSLFLTADSLPPNASFVDSGNGVGLFEFWSDYDQAGVYEILFVATDDGDPVLSDHEWVEITVYNVNRPPVLDSIGNQMVVVGDTLELTITAGDPDGDALNFFAINRPENSEFFDHHNDTATFLFHPDSTHVGPYQVLFLVNDGVDQDYEMVYIFVNSESTWVASEEASTGPLTFSLDGNFPNPFNSSTMISYVLPASGNCLRRHATLRIHNIVGALVRTLVDEPQSPGHHRVIWNGRDDRGREAASGVYLYRLRVGSSAAMGMALLLR